eukprot:jgi/Tetstr1/446905/TSEL_034363.t1
MPHRPVPEDALVDDAPGAATAASIAELEKRLTAQAEALEKRLAEQFEAATAALLARLAPPVLTPPPKGTQPAIPAGAPAPEGGEQGAQEPLPAELDALDTELEYVDFAYFGQVPRSGLEPPPRDGDEPRLWILTGDDTELEKRLTAQAIALKKRLAEQFEAATAALLARQAPPVQPPPPKGTRQAIPAGAPAPEGGEQGAQEPLPAELDALDTELEYVDYAYFGQVPPSGLEPPPRDGDEPRLWILTDDTAARGLAEQRGLTAYDKYQYLRCYAKACGQSLAPTGNGGAAERPDLLELAQSGRVGAKSVSAEDDYLAVPELLQRAESGYEAVRPVSRVPGLFPLSTDLTNEYLKQDDRRLPAQEEYLWMSCFGAHMAALFVALDELLPYVPATNQDFTPYLARARNHAEAIDKAFRFRLAFPRRLNEIKRVHARKQPLLLEWRLQLLVAGVGEDVAVDAGVAAKDAFGSDELGQRTLDLLSSSLSAQTLKSYAGRLSQFAECCHDSENISPLEATTATVVRYVAWIGERGHIAAKSLQPYLSAINTFFELHNLDRIAKDSLHLTSARRGLMLRQRRLDAAPLRVPLPADVAYRFVTKAELIVSAPYPEYHHNFRALLASVVNFMFFARGLTGVSCRVRDVHVDDYNITLQVYREKGRAGRRGPDDLRVLFLPVSEHPRVARLLHHFLDHVQSVSLVAVGLAMSNFWAVSSDEQSKPWTAATMSEWLSTAIRLVNAAPHAGTSWTSHSLRKGAASAANAIGVPLSHIRYQGGWATNSDVVMDYVDPNVLPSPGAWFFFGHIAPLHHFQVQHDSAAVAFPVPPS